MTGTVVILAHAYDEGAAAVAEAIAPQVARGAVEVVRPEGLAMARWSHRIDERGRASTRLTLANGRPLDTARIGCLFDRLAYLPNPRFARAAAKDRDYAIAELQALVGSWMVELGSRVVNPAVGGGRLSRFISDRAWLGAAAAIGLPVARSIAATAGRLVVGERTAYERCRPREAWPWAAIGPVPVDLEFDETRVAPVAGVLVTGDEVSGPLARAFGAACLDLARSKGHLLLECRFAFLAGRPRLVAVDPRPLLSSEQAVTAVARLIHRVMVGAL